MFPIIHGMRWFPGTTLEMVETFPRLATREKDIFIVSYPKSGKPTLKKCGKKPGKNVKKPNKTDSVRSSKQGQKFCEMPSNEPYLVPSSYIYYGKVACSTGIDGVFWGVYSRGLRVTRYMKHCKGIHTL